MLSQLSAIDAHQHVVPPEYARWLAAQGWHLPIPDWTADQALAAMDRQQIETALISVTTPGLYLASEPEARQFETTGDRSRTTKPAHQGRADSKSTGFTPTLPISGAVMVTICPR